QAAEALPAIQSCATNSSRPQAEPAPARQLGSLPARPRPVHPTRRPEQRSPQPPSAPTYAGHTDTPQSQHSAPDRQSAMPLPHSPAAQTTSHRPPLHRSARAHTHPSPPDGDAGSQPSPPTHGDPAPLEMRPTPPSPPSPPGLSGTACSSAAPRRPSCSLSAASADGPTPRYRSWEDSFPPECKTALRPTATT